MADTPEVLAEIQDHHRLQRAWLREIPDDHVPRLAEMIRTGVIRNYEMLATEIRRCWHAGFADAVETPAPPVDDAPKTDLPDWFRRAFSDDEPAEDDPGDP